MKRHVVPLAFVSFVGLCVTAPAFQAGKQDAKVEFSYRVVLDENGKGVAGLATKIKGPDATINLRPNVPHTIELSVVNLEKDPDEDALKEVVVQLVKLDAAGNADLPPLATAKLDKDKVRPGESARVLLNPDKALPWVGTAGKLQLRLDAKNKKTFSQNVTFEVLHPDRYLDVRKAHYNDATSRLSFDVALKKEFVGPPCVVRLVVEPEYFPGLESVEGRTLRADLNQIGQQFELLADLKVKGSARPTDARVFLTVDDYDRAAEYTPNFNDASGNMSAVNYGRDVAVRFRTARAVLPDKKNPIALTLEIDSNTIDRTARVEVGFNPSDNNKDDDKFIIEPVGGLRGLRNIKLGIDAGKKGELVCRMGVADWKVPLKTEDMFGLRWIRVRVFDEAGKPRTLAKTALKPLDVSRLGKAALELEENKVLASVILDSSRVTGVKFKPSSEVSPGEPLEVKVTTDKRAKSQAPIEKAIFYLGKRSDDKIEAPEPDQIIVREMKGDEWTTKLRMPGKDGRYEVAVQFVTETGVKTGESAFVIVKTVAPSEVLTTIKGKVRDSRKDEVKGATVKLIDAKGKQKDEQKSGADGAYAFEKVPPGDYTIEAKKAIPGMFGKTNLTVPPGQKVILRDVQANMK